MALGFTIHSGELYARLWRANRLSNVFVTAVVEGGFVLARSAAADACRAGAWLRPNRPCARMRRPEGLLRIGPLAGLATSWKAPADMTPTVGRGGRFAKRPSATRPLLWAGQSPESRSRPATVLMILASARRGSGEECRGRLPCRLREPLSKGPFRAGQVAGITICIGNA